ncbi:arf-GAP domain and FG repeat-containing protein 1-like isoform X2 [Varroa destructor]|uniref:Arf-GAP domain-containing protein n=1 Tax=Varroa destructor TaxID=109461 RepID=A0A7M7MA66_VARDE|nr:arf-GAP domain and FG repeat-containing protein 1-like isoform X2 [Varroa destructor]
MAARSKRSADERRLAHLREIANEGANRNCLECHQRGPTYVDMTIGSFVCTKCCGLLRGLNPPHRTKSITMTSFSDDELDFIKNRGNEFNRYVYLGTYDERSNLEKESLREEHKIREFMVQKYERKRWFVDPDIAQHKMQLDRRQRAAAEQGISLTGGSVSKPSSKPPATFATRSQPVTPAGGELWSPPLTATSTAPAFAAFGTASQQQQTAPANSNTSAFNDDLFAMCKEAIPLPADPFRSSSTSKEQQPQYQFQQRPLRNNNNNNNNSSSNSNNSSSSSSSSNSSSSSSNNNNNNNNKPSTIGIVDPFGQLSTASLSIDPFAASTGLALTAKPQSGSRAVLSPPPSQTHVTPHHLTASAAPAKSSMGDFADFDAAFGAAAANSADMTILAQASSTPLVPLPANAKTAFSGSGATLTHGTAGVGNGSLSKKGLASQNEISKGGAPSADRYAALAELDELLSGQKNDSVSKPNEVVSGVLSSTDPWGNHQPTPATASANPFSPTGATAPSTGGSNNPWGSPAAPAPSPASASSPNPFAIAANSWGTTIPSTSPAGAAQAITFGRITPSNVTTQSYDLAALTTTLAGVQLKNGRMTPTISQWPNNNQQKSLASIALSSGGPPGASTQTSASSNSGRFPTTSWNAASLASTGNSSTVQAGFSQTHQQQLEVAAPTNTVATRSNSTNSSCSGTGSISGSGNCTQGGADWAGFGQLAWSNGTTTSASTGMNAAGGWPNGGAGLTEVWSQMPTSASTPAFNARSHSPVQRIAAPAISKVSGGVPQSFSVHSAFGAAQWPPNGTPNGTHQTGLPNGRVPSNANPFTPNGSGPLGAARVCSTSNPFL